MALFVLGAALLSLAVAASMTWQERTLARRSAAVRPGMTESQVVTAIGLPGMSFGLAERERW